MMLAGLRRAGTGDRCGKRHLGTTSPSMSGRMYPAEKTR